MTNVDEIGVVFYVFTDESSVLVYQCRITPSLETSGAKTLENFLFMATLASLAGCKFE